MVCELESILLTVISNIILIIDVYIMHIFKNELVSECVIVSVILVVQQETTVEKHEKPNR